MKRRLLIGIALMIGAVTSVYANDYIYVVSESHPAGGIVEVTGSSPNFTLTARPSYGWTFTKWSDGSTTNPRAVTATGAGTDTYTATFTNDSCALFESAVTNPSYSGEAYGGVVNVAVGSCYCERILTAVPDPGYAFTRWSDGNTSNPRTVTISSAAQRVYSYRAEFNHPLNSYASTVTSGDGGTVTAVITNDCENEWRLTATPNDGWTFYQWSDGSITNPRTLNLLDDDYTYSASFTSSDVRIVKWTSSEIWIATNTLNLEGSTASVYVDGTLRVNADLTSRDEGVWSIDASLNSYAGQSLRIVFYCDENEVALIKDAKVPSVLSSSANVSDYAGKDIHVVSGGTLTVDANTVIGALTIDGGGRVSVPTGKTLTLDMLTMRADGVGNTYPQLAVAGSIVNNNSNTVYFDYDLDYHSYYPLALPYNVTCSAITTPTGATPSFQIMAYSGDDRAAMVSGWYAFDDTADGATLRAGTGYTLYAVPPLWNGERQAKVTLRFPMTADLTSGEAAKNVSVSTYSSAADENANWNFIANPYLANYEGDITYNATEDKVAHLSYSTDGYRSYTQEEPKDVTMGAFHGYFIQSGASGYLAMPVANRASAPQRRTRSGEQEPVRKLSITLSQGETTDRTAVWYDEQYTSAYDFNADLVKLFGSAQPLSLYSFGERNNLRAFNALPAEDILQPVALGYRNAAAGQMLFAFDTLRCDKAQWNAVWLTDRRTGTLTNLIEEDYRFTNTETQDDDRFILNAVPAPKTPTDIASPPADGPHADGIYDIMGRRCDPKNGYLPQGIYIVIENGQSRKEVIR